MATNKSTENFTVRINSRMQPKDIVERIQSAKDWAEKEGKSPTVRVYNVAEMPREETIALLKTMAIRNNLTPIKPYIRTKMDDKEGVYRFKYKPYGSDEMEEVDGRLTGLNLVTTIQGGESAAKKIVDVVDGVEAAVRKCLRANRSFFPSYIDVDEVRSPKINKMGGILVKLVKPPAPGWMQTQVFDYDEYKQKAKNGEEPEKMPWDEAEKYLRVMNAKAGLMVSAQVDIVGYTPNDSDEGSSDMVYYFAIVFKAVKIAVSQTSLKAETPVLEVEEYAEIKDKFHWGKPYPMRTGKRKGMLSMKHLYDNQDYVLKMDAQIKHDSYTDDTSKGEFNVGDFKSDTALIKFETNNTKAIQFFDDMAESLAKDLSLPEKGQMVKPSIARRKDRTVEKIKDKIKTKLIYSKLRDENGNVVEEDDEEVIDYSKPPSIRSNVYCYKAYDVTDGNCTEEQVGDWRIKATQNGKEISALECMRLVESSDWRVSLHIRFKSVMVTDMSITNKPLIVGIDLIEQCGYGSNQTTNNHSTPIMNFDDDDDVVDEDEDKDVDEDVDVDEDGEEDGCVVTNSSTPLVQPTDETYPDANLSNGVEF